MYLLTVRFRNLYLNDTSRVSGLVWHNILRNIFWLKIRTQSVTLLPPAFEVRREVIFSVCQSTPGEYPSLMFFPRSLVPGPFQRGTPVSGSFPGYWSQVLSRWGTPVLAEGGYPSPSWGMGGTPVGGTPWPGQDWGTPPPSQVRMGYPLARIGTGTPPHPSQGGYPPLPSQDSRASTCYPAGGMPCWF